MRFSPEHQTHRPITSIFSLVKSSCVSYEVYFVFLSCGNWRVRIKSLSSEELVYFFEIFKFVQVVKLGFFPRIVRIFIVSDKSCKYNIIRKNFTHPSVITGGITYAFLVFCTRDLFLGGAVACYVVDLFPFAQVLHLPNGNGSGCTSKPR